MVKRGVWLGLVVAVALVFSACSGDSASMADDRTIDPPGAEAPGGAAVAAGGSVDVLVVQPSFGFGMYAVDVEQGQATAISAPAGVSAIDLGNDVTLSDGAGFALGSALREGQTAAADISVVRVDLSTGVATQLIALGPERESDADEAGTSFSLVAVVDNQVVVRSSEFGSGEGRYAVYDATTGEQQSTFDEPVYRFESDAGSCSGGITNLSPLSDGRLVGTTLGRPALLDLAGGEIELLGMCGESVGRLGEFVAEVELGRYGVFTAGPAPSTRAVERMLDAELGPDFGVVEAWGDLWWISVAAPSIDESPVLVGGLVQFDVESRRVEAVHSLGTDLGAFADCDPAAVTCDWTTIEQAQLRVVADRLVIMDTNENGRVLLFDPAAESLTAVELDRGGTDYTSATLLAGNPSEIWIEVRRMTVTKDDDTGRSSSGPSYLERLDPTTGQINRTFAADDLFFS